MKIKQDASVREMFPSPIIHCTLFGVQVPLHSMDMPSSVSYAGCLALNGSEMKQYILSTIKFLGKSVLFQTLYLTKHLACSVALNMGTVA